MGIIPNVIELYPDELLYSWVCRLAKANCLSLHSFTQSYMNDNSKSDADVPYDLRRWFNAFYENLKLNIDITELFFKTTTFSYESIAMSKELQTKYINNTFYKRDAINTITNSRFTTIKICPQCVEEDKEKYGTPYFHRTHQLRGIDICYKHMGKLLKYIGKPGYADNFNMDDYIVIESNGIVLNKYELNFVYDLLNKNLNTSIQEIKMNLKKCEKTLVDKEYFDNKYSVNTTDIIKDLYTISKGNVDILKDIIGICDELDKEYDGEYKFVSGKNDLLKIYRHTKCGNIFCTTEHGFKSGWRCPYCIGVVTYQERIEQMIDNLGNSEYKVLSEFKSMGKAMKIKHIKCGSICYISPRNFITEGVRCQCERIVLYTEARENVEKSGDYKLIQYTKTEDPVTIQSLECGHIFNTNYRKFIKSPYCRVCRPKNMTTELFKTRIKEVTDNEYEVLDEYIDYFHRMHIKHKKCGNVFEYTPKYFLENPHCPKCAVRDDKWIAAYELLCEYNDEFGNTYISKRDSYKGYSLGMWCQRQRKNKKEGKLSQDKISKLNKIKFSFNPLEDEWLRRYNQYKRYIEDKGTSYIPRRAVYENEKLGAWVDTQKKRNKEKKLSVERKIKLLKLDKNFFETNKI